MNLSNWEKILARHEAIQEAIQADILLRQEKRAEKIAKIIAWVQSMPDGCKMFELQEQIFIEVLKRNNDNRTRTAKALGLSLRTVRSKANSL